MLTIISRFRQKKKSYQFIRVKEQNLKSIEKMFVSFYAENTIE